MARSVNEWIGKTDDSRPPDRVRTRIWERFGKACAKCTREIGEGKLPWDCDHITALALGGGNREANLRPLCKECHKTKTKVDVRIKAVYYAKRKKRAGVKKPRSITRWRKFNGEIVYASRQR